METPNPCLTCGACCAYYRASFYWAETDIATADGVPTDLTVKLNDFRVAMLRTPGPNPRCVALLGFIGKKVSCSIYDQRASVCRDFIPSWEDEQNNPRCDQARAKWGLAPIHPSLWDSPGDLPKAA